MTNAKTNANPANTIFSVAMIAPASLHFQVGDHHYRPDAAGRLMARAADVPALIEAGAVRAAAAGSTTERPIDQVHLGRQFFDSDLGKPIFWNGAAWVDAMGGPA